MNSRLESLILRNLATRKNSVVAAAIGKDETCISKISHNDRGLLLSELEAFLRSLGLEVIECEGDVVSIPEEELRALRCLARKALSEIT